MAICGFMSIRHTDVKLLSPLPVATATVANIFRKLGVTFGASAIFCSFNIHTHAHTHVHTQLKKNSFCLGSMIRLGRKCHS